MGNSLHDRVEVTVVICTRNRASQLISVLDSACALYIPTNLKWEFLVIDNGSTDHTVDVVSRYCGRLPIRCITESNPGLSNARNRGVNEAQGDYICWTDDDVLIDSNWLSAYVDAFRKHPESAVFGGKVIPFLEKPTPAWFDRAQYRWPIDCLLAHRDFGEKEIPLTFDGVIIPWGANFAIRASDQKKYRYNPELGVSPQHKRVGEETDVIYHLFKDGATGWWVPGSKVNHIIPTKRQTLKYVYEYSFLGGETFAYMRQRYPNDNYLLATGVPPKEYYYGKSRLYLQVVLQVAKLIVATLIRHKSILGQFSKVAYFMGAASYVPK